jgi:hypothetical protein
MKCEAYGRGNTGKTMKKRAPYLRRENHDPHECEN